MSDREFYEKCVSFASRFLTASQTALMKLSLSLRTHSPRIEMFQQGRNSIEFQQPVQRKFQQSV